jgi:hypothetical protein
MRPSVTIRVFSSRNICYADLAYVGHERLFMRSRSTLPIIYFPLIATPKQCNFDVQTAKPDSASSWNPTVNSVSKMVLAQTAGKKSPSVLAEKRSLSSFHSSLF